MPNQKAVIIVDDQPERHDKLVRMLHNRNYVVLMCNGSDTAAILRTYLSWNYQYNIVAILLDNDMGVSQIEGIDIARQILIEYDIPVIVISANPQLSQRIVSELEDMDYPVHRYSVAWDSYHESVLAIILSLAQKDDVLKYETLKWQHMDNAPKDGTHITIQLSPFSSFANQPMLAMWSDNEWRPVGNPEHYYPESHAHAWCEPIKGVQDDF